MVRDNYCTSAILTVLVGALMFLPVAMVRHGQDGSGSAAGKSMNVPDLRSPVVQKLPDAELAPVISNGMGGMPSFKGSLERRSDSIAGDADSFAASKEVTPRAASVAARDEAQFFNIESRV